MLDYYNDYNFKIEYDPQNNKFGFQKNAIGAHSYIDIDVATVTYTDSNSIFVSDTIGNDSTGDGTQSLPYKTILHACNSCTSVKVYVIVLDSVLYREELDTLDNEYFSGLYAATGQTPTLSLRVLDYTPSDLNTIYVSKSGNDASAGTAAAPKLTINGASGATSACDATHQNILIADSGTYTEEGWEFTGNIKNLRAADGYEPTLTIESNPDFFSFTQDISETTLDTGGTDAISCCTLNNGKIFIAQGQYCWVLNEDYSEYVAKTVYRTSGTSPGCCVLSDGNIFLVYQISTTATYYQVIDEDLSVLVSETLLQAGYNYQLDTALLSNGFVFICYEDANDFKGKYQVLDSSDWSVEKSETIFHNAGTRGAGCTVDSSDNIIIAYGDNDDSDKGKYIVLESSGWTELISETQFTTTPCSDFGVEILNNDELCIVFSAPTVGGSTNKYCLLLNSDYSTLVSETLFDNKIGFVAITALQSGDLFFNYTNIPGAGNYTVYYQTFSPSYYHLKISTNAIFNGIIFNATDKSYLEKYIWGNSATVDMSWCEFNEIQSETSAHSSWCIESDAEVNLNNCSLHDSDNGIYMTSNTGIYEDNLFYRIDSGFALHIDGTAASSGDITVNHNTFFDNYASLRLENNGGTNEIIKNCIFHDNDVYDINADTSNSLSYSVYTGTLNNISVGSSVIKSNPLFINEGALDQDDTNLQIKLRVLGYPADSPAYLLGDDTSPDRDAGAWNISPVGSVTTWTEITIEKPAEGISVNLVPIGALITRKKDGDIESSYDDLMEVVKITFKGLQNADFDIIIDIITCKNNEIRFYPDPDTYPDAYNIYKIIYDDISSSPKHFRLSRTGIENLELSFARAYE